MTDDQLDKEYVRLSDKVLEALQLSLEQKDIGISELLSRCLEMSMTRDAGGRGFVERRDFSEDVEKALNQFDMLKREARGQ